MFSRRVAAGFALLPLAVATGSVAQSAPEAAADMPPRMKVSPYLEPPPPKPLKIAKPETAGTPNAGKPASGNDERDAIFLRADRLDGESKKWVQAEGKVELRSRRETLLADWLHYDIVADEFSGKGNGLAIGRIRLNP